MPQDITSNTAMEELKKALSRVQENRSQYLEHFEKLIDRTTQPFTRELIAEYEREEDINPLIQELNINYREQKDEFIKALSKDFSNDVLSKLIKPSIDLINRFYQYRHSLLLFNHLRTVNSSSATQKVKQSAKKLIEELKNLDIPPKTKSLIFKNYINTKTGEIYQSPMGYTVGAEESYTELTIWLEHFIKLFGINTDDYLNLTFMLITQRQHTRFTVCAEPTAEMNLVQILAYYLNESLLPPKDYAGLLYDILVNTLKDAISGLPVAIKNLMDLERTLKKSKQEIEDTYRSISEACYKNYFSLSRDKAIDLLMQWKKVGYTNQQDSFTHPISQQPVEITAIGPATKYIETFTQQLEIYRPLPKQMISYYAKLIPDITTQIKAKNLKEDKKKLQQYRSHLLELAAIYQKPKEQRMKLLAWIFKLTKGGQTLNDKTLLTEPMPQHLSQNREYCDQLLWNLMRLNFYRHYTFEKQSDHGSFFNPVRIPVEIIAQGEARYYELRTVLKMIKYSRPVRDYLNGLPWVAESEKEEIDLDTHSAISLNLSILQAACSENTAVTLFDPMTLAKIEGKDIKPIEKRKLRAPIISHEQVEKNLSSFFSLVNYACSQRASKEAAATDHTHYPTPTSP